MEPLNRSISKLKPPATIIRTNSSSALSTALAVAAAMGGATKENYGLSSLTDHKHNNLPDQTLTLDMLSTPAPGTKRKAEETTTAKRPRNEPGPTNTTTTTTTTTRAATARKPITTTTTTTSTARPIPTRSAPAAKPAPATTARRPVQTTARTTTSRATAPRSTATTAKPAPTTSRTAGARGLTTTTRKTTPLTSTRPTRASPATTSAPAQVQPADTTETPESSAAPLNAPDLLSALNMAKKKKRAAWDTKGRLQDMEELTGTLHQLLHTATSQMDTMTSAKHSNDDKISELETFRRNLENNVIAKENENQTILQKMHSVEHDLQMTARQHEEQLQSLKNQHSKEVEHIKLTQVRLQQETTMIESRLRNTAAQLDQQTMENTSLRSTISAQSSTCLALESDNRALKMKIERTEDTLSKRESAIADLEQRLINSEETVKKLEQKIRDEESIRRRLHNTILELKGNIRVFCRVRPAPSSSNAATVPMRFPDQEGKEIELAQTTDSTTGNSVEKAFPFTFDKVFQPSCRQAEVFEEISQLVQSALDGYNVCIFAYGQTGSGKTHTMEGPPGGSEELMGMIPRSVLQIYENTKALESKGWTYTMEGQYVEIYNETIVDLLGSDGSDGKKHEIRHAAGKTTITDITTVALVSAAKVSSLLKMAAHNRSVGSTQMNERSSRSHSVFTLRLSGTNSITGESSEGTLNLIDLAGSERLSASGATGDRLKETQAINKSLSCLGDVIYAIANKDQHVPYRNSKLTYLLQNSLGGNSKTLMFVNISPLQAHLNETLCSLRFATKVNACTIGTATKRKV